MKNISVDTSSVAGVLLSAQGTVNKILLLKRRKEGYWCFNTGHIEEGESPADAIIREFAEETGTAPLLLYTADYVDTFFDSAIGMIRMVPVFAAYWPDAEITPVLSEEHTEFRWCTLEEAISLLPFPNQRSLLTHVWAHFVTREPSDRMVVSRQNG